MNNLSIANNEALTMSSKEIAAVVESRHDSVKRAMMTLQDKGLITFTHTVEKGEGRPAAVLHVNKRDSYVVVAQLSPEFTAVLVDRWQELEAKQQPQIPTNFAEALQLAADQAKQLELAAPKVAFVDNFVERESLQNATQVAQSLKLSSARKLNSILDEIGGIYSGAVKRSRVFTVKFINNGYGDIKQTEQGYPQSLFTTKGIVYLNELLTSEGYI
jgi:phage regulator Rha-like protein